MESYDPNSNFMEGETNPSSKEVKLKNIQKTINITSGKNNYEVIFKNKINSLSIIAKKNNGLFLIRYCGEFTLKDIQKVEIFLNYKTIDECLSEIFEGLNSGPSIIEIDDLQINISIPLPLKKYPEIIFPLKQSKNNSKKTEDLVEALLNMKKEKDEEIKLLKEKVDKLEKLLEIKLDNKKQLEEKFKGSKLQIFNIGKNEYSEYFPDDPQYIENAFGILYTFILECNKESDTKDIISSFYEQDVKHKILSIFGIDEKKSNVKIRSNKNKIYFDIIGYRKNNDENKKKDYLFYEFIKENLMLYFPLMANGLKATLTTEASLVDLFELKDQEKLNKIIYNTKLDFEGETIVSKIFMSFLILIFNDVKNEIGKKMYDLINDIFLTVINGNYTYKIKNQEMFNNFEEDFKKLISNLRLLAFSFAQAFKESKIKLKFNFNKIILGIFGSPKFKVGYFGLKFESPRNNEFFDKVFKGQIKMEDKLNLNKKIGICGSPIKDEDIEINE